MKQQAGRGKLKSGVASRKSEVKRVGGGLSEVPGL